MSGCVGFSINILRFVTSCTVRKKGKKEGEKRETVVLKHCVVGDWKNKQTSKQKKRQQKAAVNLVRMCVCGVCVCVCVVVVCVCGGSVCVVCVCVWWWWCACVRACVCVCVWLLLLFRNLPVTHELTFYDGVAVFL